MSTAGAQDPPSDQSSSDPPRPRYDSLNMRFIRSCSVSKSRNGSQRTTAIFASLSTPACPPRLGGGKLRDMTVERTGHERYSLTVYSASTTSSAGLPPAWPDGAPAPAGPDGPPPSPG